MHTLHTSKLENRYRQFTLDLSTQILNPGHLDPNFISRKLFDTKTDMPTHHNSSIYHNQPAPGIDASCIMTLRAAGALIFGKTTTTEFAATVEGGPSMNPHDQTRTPGGSSSGSGAAVGDSQVPIALGTQTGGSTIRPGSFNGIYALKPTWGAMYVVLPASRHLRRV